MAQLKDSVVSGNLRVTDTTLTNKMKIASSDYGPLSIVRTGNPYYAGIKFYNNTSTYLGSFAINAANNRFVRFKTDESTSYTILDTSLLNVTENVNLGLDGGTNAFGYVSGLTPAAWNFQQTDGTIIRQFYNANWKSEIYMDYRTGQMSTRGKNNGTWKDWRIHLDSGNFSSYAVPNTQAGMSAAVNLFATGTDAPTDNDYYISQWAGGSGTNPVNTTPVRRKHSSLWAYINGKISAETTGSGNAVTSVSYSNGKITATKGSTFSLSDHTHTYTKSKDNYTFTSSTLPNSFDFGISAGFVDRNDGVFPSYGSVLTVRTYSGGGGTLQLYAPYSPTYGGTRLMARFGNYDSSSGNSWTTLKEIAWLSDTIKVTRDSSQSTATSGYWAAMCNSTQTGSPVLPTTNKWWHVISMDWSNNNVNYWISQLAVATQDGSGVWWRRNDTGGTSIDSFGWNRLAEGDSSGVAKHAAILDYSHTNEINFSGGANPRCYFNYRNADTDAAGAIDAIDYRFCNYSNDTSKTTITAAIFNGTATWATLLKPIATQTTASASTWNIPSGSYQVWGERFSDSRLTYTPSGGSATTITDTGDWVIWLTGNATANAATLNMRIDGTYYGSFSGNLSGNATTSTTASNLGGNSRMDYGWNGVNYFNISGTAGNAAKVNDTPTSAWWHIMRFNHANNAGYYTDLAVPFNDVSLYYKRISGGSVQNGGWVKVLDSNNYTGYTVKKDGTGASGSWGISITGNANTATIASQVIDTNINSESSEILKTSGKNRIYRSLTNYTRGNVFAFIPAADIAVEYSTNNGSNWTNMGLSNEEKANLFIMKCFGNVPIGPNTTASRTTSMKTRITITFSETRGHFDQITLTTASGGDIIKCDIYRNDTSTVVKTGVTMTAISNSAETTSVSTGNSYYINPSDGTTKKLIFIFSYTAASSTPAYIRDISAYGPAPGMYQGPSSTIINNMKNFDHLYTWDYTKKMIVSYGLSVTGNVSIANRYTFPATSTDCPAGMSGVLYSNSTGATTVDNLTISSNCTHLKIQLYDSTVGCYSIHDVAFVSGGVTTVLLQSAVFSQSFPLDVTPAQFKINTGTNSGTYKIIFSVGAKMSIRTSGNTSGTANTVKMVKIWACS